jgi:hypothetical protein
MGVQVETPVRSRQSEVRPQIRALIVNPSSNTRPPALFGLGVGMRHFWRGMFWGLIAGILCGPLAMFLPNSHPSVSLGLAIFSLICLFGLQAWSFFFLKVEPVLTRVSLIVVTIAMGALLVAIVMAGTSSQGSA